MEYAHFGMCPFWYVLFLECAILECALFGMCPFWIMLHNGMCPLLNMLFLECALFGMCPFWNVPFLECALFGISLKYNMPFLECVGFFLQMWLQSSRWSLFLRLAVQLQFNAALGWYCSQCCQQPCVPYCLGNMNDTMHCSALHYNTHIHTHTHLDIVAYISRMGQAADCSKN